MALLEYANRTVQQLVTKSVVNSFYAADPLMKKLLDANRVKRSGGSSIKMVRIKSGHSDLTEINSSNINVPLVKKETFGSLTGDWAKFLKPLIIPHVDRDRASDPAEAKRLVQDTVTAAMTDTKNKVLRQIYIGNESTLKGLSSLAPDFATGTSTGLENGALQFDSPKGQEASEPAYLGQARLYDETNFVDHWHNQYVAHTGIGTDYIETMEEIKLLADSFADDAKGITLAICSNSDLVAIGKEARSYPGANAGAIMYTPADVASGAIHTPLHHLAGVSHYPNRWMTAANIGRTGAVYLLNPESIEWWVNANNSFRVTKFYDGLNTSNVDGSIAFLVLEAQLVITNLLTQGATSTTAVTVAM